MTTTARSRQAPNPRLSAVADRSAASPPAVPEFDAPAESRWTLVVEDDPNFGAWVGGTLRGAGSFGHVFHADSLASARMAYNKSCPALAVVDLHLPDGSGVDVIRDLARCSQDTSILVLTAIDDAPIALAAIRAGAHGYVVKNSSEQTFLRTVQDLISGGSPITPSIARLLLRELRQPDEPVASPGLPAGIAGLLSSRESEVLQLLTRGYRNKEVARRLDLSAHTVNAHVRSIYRKLSVNSRTELRTVLDTDVALCH